MKMVKQVGTLSKRAIGILGLNAPSDTPIFIGDANILHMQTKHPADYAKYGSEITTILSSPDYLGINSKDNSIEYVKEYKIGGEYVKVAVRVSGNGVYFVRSMYVLNTNRVNNFIKKGTLKKY